MEGGHAHWIGRMGQRAGVRVARAREHMCIRQGPQRVRERGGIGVSTKQHFHLPTRANPQLRLCVGPDAPNGLCVLRVDEVHRRHVGDRLPRRVEPHVQRDAQVTQPRDREERSQHGPAHRVQDQHLPRPVVVAARPRPLLLRQHRLEHLALQLAQCLGRRARRHRRAAHGEAAE